MNLIQVTGTKPQGTNRKDVDVVINDVIAEDIVKSMTVNGAGVWFGIKALLNQILLIKQNKIFLFLFN